MCVQACTHRREKSSPAKCRKLALRKCPNQKQQAQEPDRVISRSRSRVINMKISNCRSRNGCHHWKGLSSLLFLNRSNPMLVIIGKMRFLSSKEPWTAPLLCSPHNDPLHWEGVAASTHLQRLGAAVSLGYCGHCGTISSAWDSSGRVLSSNSGTSCSFLISLSESELSVTHRIDQEHKISNGQGKFCKIQLLFNFF